jgi:hypothetical protein
MNDQNRCKYFLCNVWWTWFSFTFRYVDDVFSLINSKFGDNVDRILSIALPRKDTTDTVRFVSYLVPHLGNDRNFSLKEFISIFPLWTVHVYVAKFQQYLHIKYFFSIDSRVYGSYQDFVLHQGWEITASQFDNYGY